MNTDKLMNAYREIAELKKQNRELTDILKKSLKLNKLQKQESDIMLEAVNTCMTHPILSDRNRLRALAKFLGFVNNHHKGKDGK